jgi:hypothetical protein
MPSVIHNLVSGENLPNTPENRIATFRVECSSDNSVYIKKYKEIWYGDTHPLSTIDDIKEAGLWDEHVKLTQHSMKKEIDGYRLELRKLKSAKKDPLTDRLVRERIDVLENIVIEFSKSLKRGDLSLPIYILEDL